MHSPGRAPGPVQVVAAAALMLVLFAFGKDSEQQSASAASPRPECASPLYNEIRKETSYPARMVARNREGRFTLQKLDLELVPPINWDQNPNRSSAFQGKLNDLSWIDPLLYAYVTGDDGALEQARDIALDWIEGNPFANPYATGRVRGDSKPWIDKVSAERVTRLAFIKSAADCEGMLQPVERRLMGNSLQTHGDFLADDANYHRTNHGLYVDRGLYLLAALAEMPDSPRWADLAAARFTDTLRSKMVGAEGFWLEHSAQYQLAIDRLVDDFLNLTDDEEPRLRRVARGMVETSGWMVEPDGRTVLYGDSNLKEPSAEELEASRSFQGLDYLPKTGLAFVRRQDPAAYLAMFASYHSTSHKDSDDLSFDLFDRGNRIISDTGLYHKDLDRYFTFQDAAKAHSTLEVAGAEVPVIAANAYGSGLYAAGEGAGWYAVWGTNPLLEQFGVDHRRLWVYRPGYALAVVDLVDSRAKQPYERHFQFGPEVDVTEEDGGALSLTAPGLDATVVTSSSSAEELTLQRGQDRPLRGYVFPDFREAVPRWTATYSTMAADMDAVTTFGLDPSEQVSARLLPGASDRSLGLRLADSAGADVGTILITREGERIGIAVSPDLVGEELPRKVEPAGG